MAFLLKESIGLNFDDVMLVPIEASMFKSRSEPKIFSQAWKSLKSKNFDTLGIIAANMDGVGTFAIAEAMAEYKCMTALHKHYELDALVQFFNSKPDVAQYCFYSMGMTAADRYKFAQFHQQVESDSIMLCIDVANGYMREFHEFCMQIKSSYPKISVLMAGNVVEANGVTMLRNAGVDIVKVGIGPSAVCMTRAVAGVGYPQFSAIQDITKKLSSIADLTLCSDGGCKTSGDVAKAFAAGATSVMLGSMLAGTVEGGGVLVDGKRIFYGMSSKTAQDRHNGGLRDYRSSEGRTVLIPDRGEVRPIISHIIGGVRSACTYLNCDNVDDLREAMYVKVNPANNLNQMFDHYTIGN